MKVKNLILLFIIVFGTIEAQTVYPHQKIYVLSQLDPEGTVAVDGRKYSGCWGWYQASKNKEYAIVGSSTKTYFIDVTNPYSPVIKDSVMGRSPACTWRELKTYQNYCYVVSDVCTPNSFQIIDMQYLPDSVHVVYDDSTYFERAHTVWVDGNKLYVGANAKRGQGSASMNLYSLATPSVPVLLRRLSDDYPGISFVHDMFVRNDTVFASAGGQGLQVFKLTASNTFTALGSLTGYAEAGYNHSSYLTKDGRTLVFCDETPAMSIKVANVTNLSNITISALTKPNTFPDFAAHNPYVIGNKWAFVSCYQDGLQLYDISVPTAPVLKGYFDTYPQGGANVGNYNSTSWRGNWGAYPYLPSGIVIACDMQNGIFILNADSVLGNNVGVKEINSNVISASIYPNPANDKLTISFINPDSKTYSLKITNILGQVILKEENANDCNFPITYKTIDVSKFEPGSYIVSLKANEKQFQEKIIIAK
ncbi:MAG TPA: choice-of-anchor B family protein [Bacteroidia bacterium]|jgi:choice-of-anchor B domain-containing protein|nr:choice-of-anchor B family protein [Bacteroidia bacterium]